MDREYCNQVSLDDNSEKNISVQDISFLKRKDLTFRLSGTMEPRLKGVSSEKVKIDIQ